MDHLFSKTGSVYTPTAYAAGPFGNLHGGAAAAIMASAVLDHIPPGFFPVSQRSEFLRSTPLSDLEVAVTQVRDGKTQLVFDATIKSKGSDQVSARTSISFYKPVETELIEPTTLKPWGGHTDPNSMMTAPDMPSPSGAEKWMICATDVRTEMKGVFWFRWRGALVEGQTNHWFTRLVGPSDWVGGFIAPGFPMPSKVGVWPNTDLSVQVDRPLIGDWIGLRPRGQYRREGLGQAHAELFDQAGRLGNALASVISPLR